MPAMPGTSTPARGLGDWPDGEVLLEELIEGNAPFRTSPPAHRPKGLAK